MRDLIMYLLIVMYGSLMFYLGYDYYESNHICLETKKELIIKDTLPELTLENVLIEIIKNDIKHPLIVLKQVIWETGWLKCKNCSLDYNNLCGMGWNGKTYHKYNHWTESIQAYHAWQLKYYKEGDYYQFLENIGYATDSNYINKLKSIELNE